MHKLTMYKHFFLLPLSLTAFILTLLPGGAMCNIPISEEEVQLVTFSHFDTAYFGLTNFAPFFTALAAVIALVFLCVYCFTQWHWFFNAAKHFLFAGIVFSLLPLLFGAQFVTTVGILLSVIMTAQLALMHFLIKDPAAK